MELNKSVFIAAAVLLSTCAFPILTLLFAEAVRKVPEVGIHPFLLFSLGKDPAQCPEGFVDPLTEGPFYKTGSPERTNLIEEGIAGEPLTLSGYVFDRNCRPVPGAWLDFWQADGNGNYDNSGHRLRGHQFTDAQGKYLLRTVIPGSYPGRTGHIHVKAAIKEGADIITSQLYFPGKNRNERDPFFRKSMLIRIDKSGDGSYRGYFNFRLNAPFM